MKKIMVAVAGLAMAVALTGCGGSPKGVAEKFAEAVAQKDGEKALSCVDTTDTAEWTEKKIKKFKEEIEQLGKSDKINDDQYKAETIREEIEVPAEDVTGYTLVNGKKYTGERAKVTIQYVKGKDKKSVGMKFKMVKVDGSWKVSGEDGKPGVGLTTIDTDK